MFKIAPTVRAVEVSPSMLPSTSEIYRMKDHYPRSDLSLNESEFIRWIKNVRYFTIKEFVVKPNYNQIYYKVVLVSADKRFSIDTYISQTLWEEVVEIHERPGMLSERDIGSFFIKYRQSKVIGRTDALKFRGLNELHQFTNGSYFTLYGWEKPSDLGADYIQLEVINCSGIHKKFVLSATDLFTSIMTYVEPVVPVKKKVQITFDFNTDADRLKAIEFLQNMKVN